MQHFRFSIYISLFCLGLAGYWGYLHGGIPAAGAAIGVSMILATLEVSLSFDNAVVNASVLKHWNAFWQRIFLTLGMLIAVFGMRLVFPLVIVAVAADLGLTEVWDLALNHPASFSAHLSAHHAEVAAFGGIFLLLVFLNFLIDHEKELHWLGAIEAKVARIGRVKSVPILIALCVVMLATYSVGEQLKYAVMMSGIWGIIIYVGVDLIGSLLESEQKIDVGSAIKTGGVGGFLYLEVLDASFSFDGVIGAFAITNDVVVIMLGLAIGAFFVRSLTVYLVHQGTLDHYIYLEHGAHYAIGALAVIMFASINYHIPEIVTGLIGVTFIAASLWSSIRHRNKA